MLRRVVNTIAVFLPLFCGVLVLRYRAPSLLGRSLAWSQILPVVRCPGCH